MSKRLFDNRLGKLSNKFRIHPIYKCIPSTAKLGVKDYRFVVGGSVCSLIRWWTDLIAPIYKGEKVIDKAYNRVLDCLYCLKKIKLNRGKKDKQIKKYLREFYDFDKTCLKDTDWWGEKVQEEVISEVWINIDDIINFITNKNKNTPQQYLNKYLENLKERWQNGLL